MGGRVRTLGRYRGLAPSPGAVGSRELERRAGLACHARRAEIARRGQEHRQQMERPHRVVGRDERRERSDHTGHGLAIDAEHACAQEVSMLGGGPHDPQAVREHRELDGKHRIEARALQWRESGTGVRGQLELVEARVTVPEHADQA